MIKVPAIKASESRYQALVVGAGPTGLMLACELKLAGVDVSLIERRAAGTTGESRAPGVQSRTMEVFEQRGLARQFKDAGRPLAAVLFSGLPIEPRKLDPAWPDGLIVPQHQTERILTERAMELDVPIVWSAQLVDVQQDTDGVTVLVRERGTLKSYRADYLIGCDGGRSATRQLCEVGFPGEDPLSHWLVADVQLDAPPDGRGAFGRNTRIGTYQVSRVEPDWFRVSLMTVSPPVDRTASVTIEELRRAMIDGIGTDYGMRQARWLSRFSDGFRQVEQYRHGRVFLAGDAAHTHSPIGGQGLNLGIQDALNLGWKLGAVLRYGAADTLLDTYHDERHPTAQGALLMARAQTALIKPGTQVDALRESVARMLAEVNTSRELAGQLSGLSLRYAWGEGQHPLVGCRMPDVQLHGASTGQSLFGIMGSGRPLLVHFSNAAIEVSSAWRERLDIVEAAPPDDSEWHLPVFGSVPALTSAFVRPDGYVAWLAEAGRPPEPAMLVQALARWLG